MKLLVFALLSAVSLASAADLTSLQKSADAGDAEAQFQVGRVYLRGDGVPKDEGKAAEWFRRAAEQGNFKAQHNLGAMAFEGRGIPQDDREAARWLRLAAEQGTARSQVMLAGMLLQGRGAEKNVDEALIWYRRAAEQGDESAQLALAEHYYFRAGGPDYVEAVKWYRPLAERGHPAAQNALGIIVERGLHGEPADPKAAAEWFSKAARQGERKAQANLGRLYHEGRGLKRDVVQAYAWLKVAAARGEATAINMLPGVEPALKVEERTRAEELMREYERFAP